MTDKELHESILRGLPEDFIRRMRNWARGRDGAAVATSSLLPPVDNGGYREARMPILFGEAQDTESALRKIPQRYQEVVATFWLYENREIRWMATATPRLRIWKLGPTSFVEKLEIGHAHLRGVIARAPAARERTA